LGDFEMIPFIQQSFNEKIHFGSSVKLFWTSIVLCVMLKKRNIYLFIFFFRTHGKNFIVIEKDVVFRVPTIIIYLGLKKLYKNGESTFGSPANILYSHKW
jgi:hypothetical protein